MPFVKFNKIKLFNFVLLSLIFALTISIFIILKIKNEEINNLKEEMAQKESVISTLKTEISKKDELIETHKTLIAALRKGNTDLEKKYDGLIRAVDQAAKSVTLFKKRAEADEMLLAKYSKVFFLNEHYVPEHLDFIPSDYTQNGKQEQFKSEALPFLTEMLNDMKASGLNPKVASAYRSFQKQKNLKSRYLQVYGAGANTFSADQGYSEHQLGTTVDISANSSNLTEDFENTDEFKWLKDNAWKYGFVMSYPKNNVYYMYEPWHWRFVGKALSKRLHEENKYFYDLNQNEIYKYLINIFDK